MFNRFACLLEVARFWLHTANRRYGQGILSEPNKGAYSLSLLGSGSENILTNDALDSIAKIPELKVCAVSLRKVG